ncbi:peptidase inhibitor family I36 protein [Actinomadura rayongensis]|uniref:Peptidase inhibitor family I36 protein n=1 Tax=Actinomadura rayongensis TaxID=1429076 RepID=A0A6I4WE55_9ACTN|nr:peptidase inhibitor family I36 protein [Actinomadura rayongensis]MXQ67991.1 hypothetical protein [Actinomadura rayongensis]
MRVHLSALLALLTCAGIVAGAPPGWATAQGGPAGVRSFEDCPQGRMCIWYGSGGTGARLSFARRAPNLAALEGHLNDHVFSAWNRTRVRWCLWEHADFHGERRAAQHEPLAGSRGEIDAGFARKISSLKPC